MKKIVKKMAISAAAMLILGQSSIALSVTDVKVAYRFYGTDDPWLAKMVEDYKKVNPEINIVPAPITASESDYYAKLALLLKTDDSIGVVIEDTFTLQANVAAGFYSEIPGVEDWSEWPQFYDGVKEAGKIDGKYYGIPYSSDVRGIYFNRNMMESIGLDRNWQPTSWDDIKTTAIKIKEKYPDVLPFWFYGGKGESSTMQTFQMLMYGTGDQMYENGKWVAESPGMLAAFKFIQDMTKEGLSAKPSLATSQQADKTIWEGMFPKDKVAMMLDGIWSSTNFRFYGEGIDKAFENYGFAKMPKQNGEGFTTMSGGMVFAIPAIYPNKDAALEVTKFLAGKQAMVDLYREGAQISPRKDVAETDEYKRSNPIRVQASDFLNFTHFRPATEQYPAISNELQRMIEAVVVGDKTPEEAMKEYGAKVEKIVGAENVIRK